MIIVRRADVKDFQKIIEIMKKSINKEELESLIPAPRASHEFLKLKEELRLSEHGIIVAEKHGNPVGFAFSRHERDHIKIEEIDVMKEYQGQDVGKALVQYIEKNALEKGIRRLETGTLIDKDGNPWKAYGFWLRMGFKDAGIRVDESDGTRYVSLVKILAYPP